MLCSVLLLLYKVTSTRWLLHLISYDVHKEDRYGANTSRRHIVDTVLVDCPTGVVVKRSLLAAATRFDIRRRM